MTETKAAGATPRRPRADRKRGLVLAGGGLKAAYSAGVLELLLPALTAGDTRPAFSAVEASSSGIWNAAMMASERSPGQIGDLWRHLRPLRALSLNWLQLPKLSWGESLLTYKRFMKRIVRSQRRGGWGLNLPIPAVKHGTRYSFNAYNFTRHSLVSFGPEELDTLRFQACVTLPRWFPPVRIDKEVYVDAVFATDSNAAALLELDLDEIWVIWTVDVRGAWHNGWVANYFRILEQAAAAAYRRERKLITKVFKPAAIASPNDKILYEISGDVPLHYLFAFTRGGMRRAVKQGGDDASAYLDTHQRLWAEP